MFRIFLSFLLLVALSLEAKYQRTDEGVKRVGKEREFDIPHIFHLGKVAYAEGNWKEAINQFRKIGRNAPHSTYASETFFLLALSYYNLERYRESNAAFSDYLKYTNDPAYFDTVIEYKFTIAEKFRMGVSVGKTPLDAIVPTPFGDELAIAIYDEVIGAVPSHEMAARSLYSKAFLLWKAKEYRESIENYQLFVRRFPKHELAPESYLIITDVYLDQAKRDPNNPDILPSAQIALNRFEEEFPRAEQLELARQNIVEIEELYAGTMVYTAQFYERIRRPQAAGIYYQNAIKKYPNTRAALYSRDRLKMICPQSLDEACSDLCTSSSNG